MLETEKIFWLLGSWVFSKMGGGGTGGQVLERYPRFATGMITFNKLSKYGIPMYNVAHIAVASKIRSQVESVFNIGTLTLT